MPFISSNEVYFALQPLSRNFNLMGAITCRYSVANFIQNRSEHMERKPREYFTILREVRLKFGRYSLSLLLLFKFCSGRPYRISWKFNKRFSSWCFVSPADWQMYVFCPSGLFILSRKVKSSSLYLAPSWTLRTFLFYSDCCCVLSDPHNKPLVCF